MIKFEYNLFEVILIIFHKNSKTLKYCDTIMNVILRRMLFYYTTPYMFP